jgi:hypothetical protein
LAGIFDIKYLISRSSVVCSLMCLKSEDCTAFSFQKETETCQLGLKGKLMALLFESDISTTIYTRPGLVYSIKNHSFKHNAFTKNGSGKQNKKYICVMSSFM